MILHLIIPLAMITAFYLIHTYAEGIGTALQVMWYIISVAFAVCIIAPFWIAEAIVLYRSKRKWRKMQVPVMEVKFDETVVLN